MRCNASGGANLTAVQEETKPPVIQDQQDDRCEHRGSRRMSIVMEGSKWAFSLAVVGSALLALTMFVYGFLITLFSIYHSITNLTIEIEAMKEVMAISIEIIDLFLVATVFYIISLGLYELFISKAPLPGWLKICNLDDLKEKLLGLVVMALAVLFLGEALTWTGAADIMGYGIGTSSCIIAISLYFWAKH